MKEKTGAVFPKALQAFRETLPVMAGYLVLGIGLGILMYDKGYGVGWTLASSCFIYAGSMQYLQAQLLTEGTGLVSAALATLMVNARHLFYGISMVERYRDTGKYKPYLIFALTDETYSLVCKDTKTPPDAQYLFFLSLFDQIYWVTGCVLGSLIGSVLPFSVAGLDFALTALFICVFTEQWLENRDHAPALIGTGCSLVCLFVFGADRFLIPAMISITCGTWILRAVRKAKTKEENAHE